MILGCVCRIRVIISSCIICLPPACLALGHRSLHWLTLHEQRNPRLVTPEPSARAPKHVLSPTGSLAASRLGWSGRLQTCCFTAARGSLSLKSRGSRINDERLIKAVTLQWQQRWLELSETGLIAGIYHREGNGWWVFPHVVLSHLIPACPQRSHKECLAAD